ncbi:MAG: LamG domain-containing protein [Salinivirgaceae bacterium]|nr:LamG domain-containing protein [Salinivirgaceae bacterium]MDY0279820.1 LamG domain-containing protein [Salinivirgaceae bacterium]
MRNLLILSTIVALLLGCGKEEARELKGYKFNKEYALSKDFKTRRLSRNLTIDMYVMLNAYPKSWTNVISKMGNEKSGEFSLRIKNNKEGQFYYGNGSSAIVLQWNPSEVLPLNTWVRLTAVRDLDKTELVLYANGKQVARKKFKKLPRAETSESPIFVSGTNNRGLDATFAEIRIWDKAISTSDITKTADIIKNPGEDSNLVGYLLFDNVKNKRVESLTSKQLSLSIKKGK